jgi:hypothetical protein
MLSESSFDWVEELQPNTWIKAFFSDLPKCDMHLDNQSEVFNGWNFLALKLSCIISCHVNFLALKLFCVLCSYINEAREMPMLSMLENLLYKMMHTIVGKQKEQGTWLGRICSKIKKKLVKFTEWSKNCSVSSAGGGIFHVSSSKYEGGYC